MKVAYFGEFDNLTAGILERLKKEEKDVFLLSDKAMVKENKTFSKYHNYILTGETDETRRIFSSVSPDVVIFEGVGYLNEEWDVEQSKNLSMLSQILEECVSLKDCMFVFFSATEVYGKAMDKATEDMEPHPQTLKGMWMLQEEDMVRNYQKYQGLKATILRLAPVFSGEISEASKDTFGRMYGNIMSVTELEVEEQQMQPVHVSDVADSLIRVLNNGKTEIYNVSSSEAVNKSDIMRGMIDKSERIVQLNVSEPLQKEPYIVNDKIKKELEWTDFWSIKETLDNNSIKFVQLRDAVKEKKKGSIAKGGFRRTIENIVLFLIFAAAFLLTSNHSLFSQVDWLLIYVIIVSLGYGVKQGALSVAFSSVLYLISQGRNILEMTNFYSYAESVLMIVEFVFFGIVVGYTADMLKEENRIHRQELGRITEAYEKLKVINDKNVLLKNEYEKRVLDAKTSLPRLYSIINRITVLDTARIFMEVLNVIKDLMQTETVAVYRVSANSSYLRLIDSLNKESVMEGNSWNLKNYPAIEEAIRDNRLYEGNTWRNEPAIVLPISSSKGCEAVIVIKELSMEARSLYSINVLRTLLVLISDSIEKALQYDSALRESKYVKNTNILIPEEFKKAVTLAEEKMQRRMADCCIIKIHIVDDIMDTYQNAQKMFREMDIWGIDEKDGLYVLLGNTSEQEADIVLERLNKSGISAEKTKDFI